MARGRPPPRNVTPGPSPTPLPPCRERGGVTEKMEPVGCAVRTRNVDGAQSAPYKLQRFNRTPPLPAGRESGARCDVSARGAGEGRGGGLRWGGRRRSPPSAPRLPAGQREDLRDPPRRTPEDRSLGN